MTTSRETKKIAIVLGVSGLVTLGSSIGLYKAFKHRNSSKSIGYENPLIQKIGNDPLNFSHFHAHVDSTDKISPVNSNTESSPDARNVDETILPSSDTFEYYIDGKSLHSRNLDVVNNVDSKETCYGHCEIDPACLWATFKRVDQTCTIHKSIEGSTTFEKTFTKLEGSQFGIKKPDNTGFVTYTYPNSVIVNDLHQIHGQYSDNQCQKKCMDDPMCALYATSPGLRQCYIKRYTDDAETTFIVRK